MNPEKVGNFIKQLRKEHNLTQKQFAKKYHVTYQAVSKWETGKNMPDAFLIKQMSEDFNISIEEIYNGEYSKKKNPKKLPPILIIITLLLLFIITWLIFQNKSDNSFQFKTLSASCDNFNISGTISYNQNKSAIYITNIQYCGKDATEEYQELECILYESNQSIDRKIDFYKYEGKSPIKLEEFLKEVTFSIDNYEKSCKEYQDNTLYLSINAKKQENKSITYKIPLKLESCPLEKK